MEMGRKVRTVFLSTFLFISLSGFNFQDLGGLLGSLGGGSNWTQIVKDWKSGLGGLAKESVRLGYAQADLAEALGLKQEAALMRGQAKNLEQSGDSFGGSDLNEFGKSSVSIQEAINAKIRSTAKLSAADKAAMAQAGVKLSNSLVGIGKGVFILVQASSRAASSGVPNITDIFALPVALEIPIMIPAAAFVIPKIFEVCYDFQKVAKEKNVAMPEIPKAPMFG
jgi:hypothetical protein